MAESETWRNVGSKIRFLRKANGLTLKQLARGCDLSANTISMVERSEVSPSIETICKIANALGVSPSSLFLEICHPRVIVKRADEDRSQGQVAGQALNRLSAATCSTTCGSKAAPGTLASSVPQYFILCLCGQVELEMDGQNFSLNPGDTLTFSSDAFHRWHNPVNAPGIAVLVLSG